MLPAVIAIGALTLTLIATVLAAPFADSFGAASSLDASAFQKGVHFGVTMRSALVDASHKRYASAEGRRR